MQIHTTITREDYAGDPEEIDVVVTFHTTHYVKGVPAQLYGPPENCYPAEDPEYTFAFDNAYIDSPRLKPPSPLTPAELTVVEAWFVAHHDLAVDAAEEARADMEYEDADRKLDERRDAMLWENDE